jgi:hypothetical protein
MEQFNIEYQYQLFLKRMALSEATMPAIQKKQLRQTFFGASGQMLLLLRDEVSKLEEDKAMKTLDSLLNQVTDFLLGETNQRN